MASSILIISRLWQVSVGFRPPRSATSSSLSLLQQRRTMVVSSSVLNTAACHHHNLNGDCDDDHHLTSLRLPFNISTTRRNWPGAGTGQLCSFQFQQINRKTPGHSFASRSKSNERSQNPPVKAKFDGERSGWQQKREQKELLTVAFILDNYMRRCKNLMPYQVTATWNDLSKSVQKSRKRKRQNFWIDHKAILQMLVDQTIHSVYQFDGRSTATVTHSLVKLLYLTNLNNPGELQSLWNALLTRTILLIQLDGFNAQDVSNLLWAYAKADGIQIDGRLLDALAKTALVRIDEFAVQGLANVAWGFAKLNHKVPLLFDVIARAAQVHIDDFNPQELSNMIMAYAKMNHKLPELFDVIARAAQMRIDDFNPKDFSDTSWSFATMNHEAPSLFDAMTRAARRCINDFTPQQLSNLAWAFATLNHKAPSLFYAIARAAQVHIDGFNQQELATTAWAFAVFNIEPNSFTHYKSPFAQALLSSDPSTFTVEALCHLHQFHLWCKVQKVENWFSEELQWRCREAFVSTEAEPSRLQNDVMESLRTLQDVSQVEIEFLTESGYRLDAVLVFQGKRIGVEVERPTQFVGQSHSVNGKTLLKHRQLRALEGWKLVTIPCWEWAEIDTGSNTEREEKRRRYLQNLLNQGTQ